MPANGLLVVDDVLKQDLQQKATLGKAGFPPFLHQHIGSDALLIAAALEPSMIE